MHSACERAGIPLFSSDFTTLEDMTARIPIQDKTVAFIVELIITSCGFNSKDPRLLPLSVHGHLHFSLAKLQAYSLFTSPTHPKVGEQRCVSVGQHGVAGTQSLHVHVGGEGRRGRVGQRLS